MIVRFKYLLLIMIILTLPAGISYAQFHTGMENMVENEELERVKDWIWKGKFYPFIEVTTGKSALSRQNFAGCLPEESLLELKLGYSQLRAYRKFVWELDERFVYGSYLADDFLTSMSLDSGDFAATISRFGFGNRLGYGYELGSLVLILYNLNGFNWSEIRTERSENLSETDNSILDRYERTYRFGINAEGGIRLQLAKSFSLSVSYETAVIYPRVIFWEWVGSHIIYQIGMGMISTFTDDIISSSPAAGPLFYFLLKNGLSYAYYQGVRNKMNWPFNSETPMMLSTIKFGLSLTF